MCGIVGLHNLSNNNIDLVSSIKKMNLIQIHRGPDQEGEYINLEQKIALSMRRLSIIDIESGKQPMISKCKNYILVYNGEIFNAPELRVELENSGEVFETNHSDTEVLFKLLISSGENKIHLLNGMFAFAFYNLKKNELLIGRDRAGIKPLYFTFQNGMFAFASELKSLLTLNIVEKKINLQSLFHFLSLMYVPSTNSIIDKIQKLEGGKILKYNLLNGEIKIYNSLELSFKNNIDFKKNELNEKIYEIFLNSVKRWTYSDVPIACALSGGLDSSAIIGALTKLNINVKTYSLGYAEDVDNKKSDLFLSTFLN